MENMPSRLERGTKGAGPSSSGGVGGACNFKAEDERILAPPQGAPAKTISARMHGHRGGDDARANACPRALSQGEDGQKGNYKQPIIKAIIITVRSGRK